MQALILYKNNIQQKEEKKILKLQKALILYKNNIQLDKLFNYDIQICVNPL